jgi:hypothetical protein
VTLQPLPPAIAAGIADDRLPYAWDEWKVRSYFDFADEPLLERLTAVSGRGSIALATAAGEWVCQRFSRVSADPVPWQFLEAVWAAQIVPGRCRYTEIVEDDWRGVVRGPMAIAITIANDALFCLDEDPNTAVRAMWMTNLARHVLPRRDAFDQWFDVVTERLILHHPVEAAAAESLNGDNFKLGRPVARELFDSTRIFSPSEEPALIKRFLESVDPENPYLAANVVADEE